MWADCVTKQLQGSSESERAAQTQSRPILTLHTTSKSCQESTRGRVIPNINDPDSRNNTLRKDPKAPKTRSMTQGQIPRRRILAQHVSQPKNRLSITQQLALIHANVALTRGPQWASPTLLKTSNAPNLNERDIKTRSIQDRTTVGGACVLPLTLFYYLV